MPDMHTTRVAPCTERHPSTGALCNRADQHWRHVAAARGFHVEWGTKPEEPLPPPPGPNAAAAGRNGRWVRRLGEVGVDSASIGITDLLVGTTDCKHTPASEDPWARYAERGTKWAGDWGTGIRFPAGFGDGGYDIWAWIVDYGEGDQIDERVAQVVVTMIDDAELADWRSGYPN